MYLCLKLKRATGSRTDRTDRTADAKNKNFLGTMRRQLDGRITTRRQLDGRIRGPTQCACKASAMPPKMLERVLMAPGREPYFQRRPEGHTMGPS